MTGFDDTTRMAAGIAAIRQNARAHDEIGTGVPAPPDFPGTAVQSGRRLALSVQCPYCKAQPGSGCQITVRRPMAGFHPGRLTAARAAQAQKTESQA